MSPSNEGFDEPRNVAALSLRRDGVTRNASNTASTFRSAVSRLRSDLMSPTSATYQFFASWSSTLPP
jgi:hypothetical protein